MSIEKKCNGTGLLELKVRISEQEELLRGGSMRRLKTIKGGLSGRTLDLKGGDIISIKRSFLGVSFGEYEFMVMKTDGLRTTLLDIQKYDEQREVRSAQLWKLHQNLHRGKYPQLKLVRRGHAKSTSGQTTDTLGSVRSSPDASEQAEDKRTRRRERRRR
jgi:hypothetical protein